ncbi:MAG: FAD-dependent oxidoreductase, partial [Candidatus Saccharimonadales bacterium]
MNTTIVGGGFGGVKAALELAKNTDNSVTLITDKPDFQYYPALYGAATGRSHLESWVPLKEIFAGKNNVTVIIDSIASIDPAAKQLTSQQGTAYAYQTCIMSLGTVTTYFGIAGLDTYSYGIKSAGEVATLKEHIYEDLLQNNSVDKRYVVIGAGPTGTELAAAMGSYLRRLSKKLGVTNSKIHIDLIEAAPRVMPRMSERASKMVDKRLRHLGVNVMTNQKVESASDGILTVGGRDLLCHTVIWTSGVANHPFYKSNEAHFTFAPNGRIEVNEFMQVSGADDLYVIGDNAATPFTGLAQTALHDGIFVAGNLRRQQAGQPMTSYKAVMPVVVVPVGAYWAIVEWKKIVLKGWVGAAVRKAADFMG